ncbi:cell division cycle-associated protein 7-like isoform X1 [Pomacea canaliculata]|uniref:cell division cycle-associated protein 7-like isoform X1 n=1 Tax=Pomacea canaliculata TaxID=400727 RepID=UPI000D7319C6|nr:cell division cycle-associated protein 7-like isoform X1 [Pomacea canaliculata]XP_025093130.1 cell division cycle-associated protein 7-like isoform X1 [Pomacea canaliculata]
MLTVMETPEKTSPNEYEEIRRKNLEDNKIMLAKLMADMKNVLPGKPPVPQVKGTSGLATPVKNGPIRRNPSRHARYHPSRMEPPRTRARSNSVSSSVSTSSSCTPESTPEKLVIRFGFFRKTTNTEVDSDAGADDDRNLDLPSPSRKPRVYRDERSAAEITDEDLELVATCVADKKYDSIYGTTCHQCRQKTQDMKTICRSPECGGVRGQFCGPCLRNRYGEDAKLTLKDPNWQCPSCRGICNCSFCRRRKGKSCTGILIHLAREQGYSDVHSYLKGLSK